MDDNVDETSDSCCTMRRRKCCSSHGVPASVMLAMWTLGMCNNFPFVIMLSCASDELKEFNGNSSETPSTTPSTVTTTPVTPSSDNGSEYIQCNSIGTGAVLLADILPTLAIKLILPWFTFPLSYSIRVLVVWATATASLLIASLAHSLWLLLFGVTLASFAGGLGEFSFVSLTTFFKGSMDWFAGGTGVAGIAGAGLYALLAAFIKPKDALFYLAIIPTLIPLSYYFLLRRPVVDWQCNCCSRDRVDRTSDEALQPLTPDSEVETRAKLTTKEKIQALPTLISYAWPLFTVYVLEYYINQALMEVLYTHTFSIGSVMFDRHVQYRIFQLLYQIGVCISRFSGLFFSLKKTWLCTVVQAGIFIVLLLQVFKHYLPFYVVIIVILVEGLMGGTAYVQTFNRVFREVIPRYREFAMGTITVFDATGIVLAGILALETHDLICGAHIKF